MNKTKLEKLEQLLDERQEIVLSERNRKNRAWWRHTGPWCRDMWRGIPRGRSDRGIPFLVAPDNSIWRHVFDMDLRDYYSDSYTHLEKQIAIDIYKFKNFQDDSYLDEHLFIWFGVVTELSFFGVKLIFFKNREAWIEEKPLLDNYENLDRMEFPDFYKSGLMPRIHRFYQDMGEMVRDRFKIMFPDWVRGPFCMAAHLRGLQNLLMDMIANPDFVHRLMRFVTDAHKHWVNERSKFLAEPIQRLKLYNDEIDCPTLAPHMYREFILPYEMELAQFHGGVTYWHSCGNTTVFVEDIHELPDLEMFHVSPWSDLPHAVNVMGGKIALDVNLDPMKDVLECDADQIKSRLRDIVKTCGEIPFCIRADAFQIIHGTQKDLAKIKLWAQVARRFLHNLHQ